MTKKKINVIIIIMVIFFALFFAGSFAYEEYRIRKSDQEYSEKWEKEEGQLKDEHSSGNTNEDLGDQNDPIKQ